MKFRVKLMKYNGIAVKTDHDEIIKALNLISQTWNLNREIINLITEGIVFDEQGKRAVMLCRVDDEGRELPLISPLDTAKIFTIHEKGEKSYD